MERKRTDRGRIQMVMDENVILKGGGYLKFVVSKVSVPPGKAHPINQFQPISPWRRNDQ
jgi:hypothetical protein